MIHSESRLWLIIYACKHLVPLFYSSIRALVPHSLIIIDLFNNKIYKEKNHVCLLFSAKMQHMAFKCKDCVHNFKQNLPQCNCVQNFKQNLPQETNSLIRAWCFDATLDQWLQTKIKPRICKTSEHCFLHSHLKVLVKLSLKIEKMGFVIITWPYVAGLPFFDF